MDGGIGGIGEPPASLSDRACSLRRLPLSTLLLLLTAASGESRISIDSGDRASACLPPIAGGCSPAVKNGNDVREAIAIAGFGLGDGMSLGGVGGTTSADVIDGAPPPPRVLAREDVRDRGGV